VRCDSQKEEQMNDKSTARALIALASMPDELILQIAKDIRDADFQRTDPPEVQDLKMELLFRKYPVLPVPRQ
jgi:hypothetical protein